MKWLLAGLLILCGGCGVPEALVDMVTDPNTGPAIEAAGTGLAVVNPLWGALVVAVGGVLIGVSKLRK